MRGGPPADAGDLHRLVVADHRRQRAAPLPLQLLGLGDRHAQADRDVVGEVVAADRHHRRVPQAAALEDGEVGRAAADVDQRHAELLLVGGQHGFARGELLEHRLLDVHARLVHRRDDVLRGRGAAGDDVDVHLEAGAGHADRVADAVLVVDDEVLGQDVDDLAPARQADGARRVDGPAHVVARDLPVLAGHRHDAAAVEALDVRARQRDVRVVDLDARRELRLLDRLADRLDGGLEIHDGAAADALRIGDAETDDLDLAAAHHFADNGRHLRRAQVEPDEVPLFTSHDASTYRCGREPGSWPVAAGAAAGAASGAAVCRRRGRDGPT